MKPSLTLSIIIVSYNTKDLTLQCLSSIHKTTLDKKDFEVIVVDNASADGSAAAIKKAFSEVIVVSNTKNIGFSAGNNVAIRRAKGRYILLLNSDTEVKPETFQTMLAFMEKHPHIGVSTCRLVLANGFLDKASHRGFPTPWASFTYMIGLEKLFPKTRLFGQYHLGYKDMTVPHEIDCPSGAFFLVCREVIDQVGLLDEDYFMYGEDIDWAYRIKEKGWEIWFNPYTSILHIKKQSGRKHADKTIFTHANASFYETMKLFYKKHYEEKYPWVVTRLVYLVLDLRIMTLCI